MRARAAHLYVYIQILLPDTIYLKIDDLTNETLYFNKSILAGDGSCLSEAKKGDSGRFKRFWSLHMRGRVKNIPRPK